MECDTLVEPFFVQRKAESSSMAPSDFHRQTRPYQFFAPHRQVFEDTKEVALERTRLSRDPLLMQVVGNPKHLRAFFTQVQTFL